MKYSIVFPCYNESENLPNLIDSIKRFSQNYNVEFILVQNGSKDNSEVLLRSLLKDVNRTTLCSVPVNKGYGYGIKQGLKLCSGDFVCWMHSDMQLDPSVLYEFFDYIERSHNKQLFLKGERHNRSIIDHIFTKAMGIFESILFRTYVFDVMSMPVIIRKDIIKIDLLPDDFSIDIYTYILAKRKKMDVVHLPVYMKNRTKGVSSWNTGFISRIRQSIKIINASRKINL